MSRKNARIVLGSYYDYLKDKTNLTSMLVDAHISKFADGEISVSFPESLRTKHLFIFGETSNNLTELLLTIDAAKRSSVKEITVVLPYYGYSRQDKREGSRGCLGASVIAQVLQALKIDRIITMDLHAEQIQGYFHGLPVEHIMGKNLFLKDETAFVATLRDKFGFSAINAAIIAPDAGGTLRASRFATQLSWPLVTINKRRDRPGSISHMEVSGDVKGRDCIIIDDIGDSCGTLSKAADLLKQGGATTVIALITHGVLSKKASENLSNSKLDGMVISNTLKWNLSEAGIRLIEFNCMTVIDEAILGISEGSSILQLTGS
jgi:ribose-phosphate pyrophosphokinase